MAKLKLEQLTTFNPLLNLTIREAQSIYDASRMGNYRRLQHLYHEMEQVCPTLLLCVERRLSAVSSRKWQISTIDDSPEAISQKKLVDEYLSKIDNFNQAIEHLALSFFRGFSFIEPYENTWRILPQDHFTQDPLTGVWSWWPNNNDHFEIEKDNFIFIERARPVDYPIMSIYLRSAVGEREYGRFIDRYGLPPVSLTLPEIVDKDDVSKFTQAAQDISNGQSGVLPYGTSVSFAEGARGTDPFKEFLLHQEKEILRLCTGGTLSSLSESGSGTLAGNAQAQVWEELTERDADLIAEAITKWISHAFGTDKIYFNFMTKSTLDSQNQLLDMYLKIKTLGYDIPKSHLDDLLGINLDISQDENNYTVPK